MFHKYLTVSIAILIASCISFDVCWDYLEPYFASYLKSFDKSLTISEVHVLYYYGQYAQFLGSLAFGPISIYLGHREGIQICFILLSLGYFMIGSTDSISVMKVAMSCMGYAIINIGFHASYLLIGLFPKIPGTATGLANIGGPIAIFTLGTLSRSIINPQNIQPSIEVKEGDRKVKYFDSKVTDNFSELWFYLAIFNIFIGIILVPIMKNSKGMFSLMEEFPKIFQKKEILVDYSNPIDKKIVSFEEFSKKIDKKNIEENISVATTFKTFNSLEKIPKKIDKKNEEENKSVASTFKTFESLEKVPKKIDKKNEEENKSVATLEKIESSKKFSYPNNKKFERKNMEVETLEEFDSPDNFLDPIDKQNEKENMKLETIPEIDSPDNFFDPFDKKNERGVFKLETFSEFDSPDKFLDPIDKKNEREDIKLKTFAEFDSPDKFLDPIDKKNEREDIKLETFEKNYSPNNFLDPIDKQNEKENMKLETIEEIDNPDKFLDPIDKKNEREDIELVNLEYYQIPDTLRTPSTKIMKQNKLQIQENPPQSDETPSSLIIENYNTMIQNLNKEDPKEENSNLMTELLSVKFLGLIFSMAIQTATVLVNHINYKTFGLEQKFEDKTLMQFSFIATIMTCQGRIISGMMIDKFGYTRSIRIYISIFAVSLVIFNYYRHNFIVFFGFYSIISFGFGFMLTSYAAAPVCIYGLKMGSSQQSFIGLIPLLNALFVQVYDGIILVNLGFNYFSVVQLVVCTFYLIIIDKFGWG